MKSNNLKGEIATIKKRFLLDFGKHVKNLRLEKGMTQQDLAEKCFTNSKKIGRIERGEYSFEFTSIYILALGLNVQIPKLMVFDEVKKYEKELNSLKKTV